VNWYVDGMKEKPFIVLEETGFLDLADKTKFAAKGVVSRMPSNTPHACGPALNQ
jgi:hypothetical protein